MGFPGFWVTTAPSPGTGGTAQGPVRRQSQSKQPRWATVLNMVLSKPRDPGRFVSKWTRGQISHLPRCMQSLREVSGACGGLGFVRTLGFRPAPRTGVLKNASEASECVIPPLLLPSTSCFLPLSLSQTELATLRSQLCKMWFSLPNTLQGLAQTATSLELPPAHTAGGSHLPSVMGT